MDENSILRSLLAERVMLMAYIKSLARRTEMVEDIFQNVCSLALRKRDSIHDEEYLKKWLRTTARFEVMNALRANARHETPLSNDVLELLDPIWQRDDKKNENTERTDALRQCMSQLSPAHQELVNRRFVDGHDYDKLAAEFHRPVNSLYVTFSRIYTALGKCINSRLAAHSGGMS